MVDQGMITAGDAWDRVVRLYALPGVMPQCLSLQQQAGVGVTTLLTLVVSAARGDGAIRPATAQAVVASSDAFQVEVLRPLRQARDGLKRWFEGGSADPARSLRASLLERELAAERLEQALVLEQLAQPQARAAADDPLADTCLSVCRYFSGLGVIPDVLLQQSIGYLLSAALEDYDGLHLTRVLTAALQEELRPGMAAPS